MCAQFNEAIAGQLAAIQVALRALVQTHPNPDSLVKAFEREHNETLAILGVRLSASDVTKGAYRDYLCGFAPNPDEWLRG